MIETERFGLILHTERYEACVAFYRDTMGLRMEFQKNEPGQVLTILEFGAAYLMIEPGGVASEGPKTDGQNPVVLRLNVADIDKTATALRGAGVALEVERHDWGAIADFSDPDGNRCQLREVVSFAR